jgi:hypothetical protein
MKNLFLIFTLLIISLIVGCQSNSEEIDDPELKLELENYANSYMSELKSVLMKNMKAGGPLQAVNVCSDTAAMLTSSFSEKMGVNVKRFSLKNRNSENYPNQTEKEFLRHFEDLNAKNELTADSYLIKKNESNGKFSATLVKPIFIGALCLNCHGSDDQISSDVEMVINEKWPNDKAIGYKIGEQRGAIAVTKAL